MQQPTKANAKDLFDGKEHYVIPAYQRPYVWNEEDQWAPLWDDVVRVTESNLNADETPLPTHFLGAVVFESSQATVAGVSVHSVIDGQQRLTTMQLLLDAVQEVVDELGHVDQAGDLADLIVNSAPKYAGQKERFKLWPSRANRAEFTRTMDPTGVVPSDAGPLPQESGPISAGHAFFKREARRWLSGLPDDDGKMPPGDLAVRVAELTNTLTHRLVVVAIDLTDDDDAQLIFETLNDRGTPLLRADLIKNWVFRLGEKLNADVDMWAESIWDDFDTDWWREEITQGRMSRSRVDIFLHYWLTMRLREEVRQDRIFDEFKRYAEPFMGDAPAAEAFLRQLRSDADTYRGLGALPADTPAGQFRSRVIEAMELAATTPIFLYVISSNHSLPDSEVKTGLAALESWVVRRTMLQMTSKDMNKLVVALLKDLDDVSADEAGNSIRRFLSKQTAETRRWPSDKEFIGVAPTLRMYGNIKQGRIAVVLAAVEDYKRQLDPKYGSVTLPQGLTIEHIMPQKWREHWRSTPPLTPEQEQARDRAVHTLGNLTLVTQSLNSSLSHRPWTDFQAVGLSEGGQPGQGKWSVLSKFNLIVLNKEILDMHPDDWSELDIAQRATALATAITNVWVGPDRSVQEAAVRASQGVTDPRST